MSNRIDKRTFLSGIGASALLGAGAASARAEPFNIDTIEGWLRGLPDGLSQELRREWAQLRELDEDDFELDAIQRLIELEKLRGSWGA